MSFCKLITIQTFLLFSILTVLAIPKYTPFLFIKTLLKYQDDKTLLFFLTSFFPLFNSFLYIFFYEIQPKKHKKHFRNAYFENISLYFLTFMNVIGCYVYKVDFSTLLRMVIFIIFNNQILFICNLLRFDILRHYIIYNVLVSNLFMVGFSYVLNFELICNEKIIQIMNYKNALMKYFKNN